MAPSHWSAVSASIRPTPTPIAQKAFSELELAASGPLSSFLEPGERQKNLAVSSLFGKEDAKASRPSVGSHFVNIASQVLATSFIPATIEATS